MSSEELPIQPKGYNLLRFNLVMRDEYDPDAQLSETDGGEDLISEFVVLLVVDVDSEPD